MQVMIAHFNREQYRAMGIPDSLLPLVAGRLVKRVVSSPSSIPGAGVFRTKEASTMWRRLERKGIATYDRDKDVFTLTQHVDS